MSTLTAESLRINPTLVEVGQLIIAIAIPLTFGFAGSLVGGGDNEWYKNLKKPSWTPPAWVFPAVWSLLYILIGVASFLVYRHGGFHAQIFPLAAYAVQLLFNLGWTPIFFGAQRPDLAFVWIILLLVSVLVNIYFFYTVSLVAAGLLIPLAVWVIVASLLNFYIWQNNPLQVDLRSELSQPLHGGHSTAGTLSA